MSLLLASLPSPPSPVVFEVGPFALRYYGLCIVLGIVVATWLTARELERKGYDGALALDSLFFVVPLGVVGARAYHVITEYDAQYASNQSTILAVWEGGLGIYGGVVGGFLGLLVFARVRRVSALAFADAAAPGLVLAQAIGRWGDYFNQELFGYPSGLPWAIQISPQNRPAGFADVQAFHPTFLYECVWDALVCVALLWVARRFAGRLKDGDVFLLYVSLYSVGRFFVEILRVDPTSFLISGSVRGNLVVGGVLAFSCTLVLLLRHSHSSRQRFQAD